jgi:hypothetical protein
VYSEPKPYWGNEFVAGADEETSSRVWDKEEGEAGVTIVIVGRVLPELIIQGSRPRYLRSGCLVLVSSAHSRDRFNFLCHRP